MREFVVMTRSAKGGTEAVTISAADESEAREKVLRLGYHEVVLVL